MIEKEKQNIDLTGTQWKLAPGARELIDQCESRTWQLHLEILALSALFRNMQSCEIKSEELYGLSLTIERIGTRLGKISENISKVVMTEKKI